MASRSPFLGEGEGPLCLGGHRHLCLLALQLTAPGPASSLLVASYENRVTFSASGITFHSVTRKDTGTYTCMVSDEGGNTYGEVTVNLIVLGTCHRSSMWACSLSLP